MTTGAQADGPAAKLRLACDLFDSGVAMMRQTLRRRFPTASERTIADALARWLLERPGAEYGDAPGRVREWPPAGS
jgi:hypothetical protein